MTEDEDRPPTAAAPSRPQAGPASDPRAERDARLARALRQNLLRRKAQGRARADRATDDEG